MNLVQRISYKTAFALITFSDAALAFAAGTTGLGGEIPPIAGSANGVGTAGIRSAVVKMLTLVLNFLALLAIIFIVVAGIRLIVSQGEDEQKDKAKKTILYVIVGLIIILFARVIVGFFTGIGAEVSG